MTDSRRLAAVLSTLAAALVVLPAVAGSETVQTVNALGGEEYGAGYKYPPYWSPAEVKVESGGQVTFTNSSATVKHGIVWTGPVPACAPGVPVGAGGSKTSWSGSCTFSQPGEYAFYCSFHGPAMSGKIVVHANGTIAPAPGSGAPASPTDPGGSVESPGPTGPLGGAGGSPFTGGSHALKLAAGRHGPSVHGSIDVSPAGAGGKLEVALLASSASLAAHRPSRVRIGRYLRSSVQAGVASFAVGLNARGRSALRRHKRLAVTVRIELTPVTGAPASMTRSVVLHG